MALKEYKKKRDFHTTIEPKGVAKKDTKTLRFVVQEHHASHLHYDFRIEVDGVLKSWAVPKGPPTDPEDKRLAIMVEDHPLDYADFEGTIAEGNYGAGKVIIWDRGDYLPAGSNEETPLSPGEKEKINKLLHQQIQKGHVDIILNGQKLRGEFNLVRMKNADNKWLFLKKKKS